jgi:inorganic pyrophosphatase
VSAPTFPGCVIPVKAIALFRISDEGERDDKLLCVPQDDPAWNEMESHGEMSGQLRAEIEHFWSIYKLPEGRRVEIHGWEDRDAARALIDEGRRRFRDGG